MRVVNNTSECAPAIDVSINDAGNSVTIKQSAVWSDISTCDIPQQDGLGVWIRNSTSTPASVVSLGADWQDLAGAGQTFTWTTTEEIDILLYGLLTGQYSRGAVVGGEAAQAPIVAGSNQFAALLEISENGGLLRPQSTQQANWTFEFLPLQRPSAFSPRYTNEDAVLSLLTTPKGSSDPAYAGGNIGSEGVRRAVVRTIIQAVENCIDVRLNRPRGFEIASTQPSARTFRTWNGYVITDEFVGTPTQVAIGDRVLRDTQYEIYEPAIGNQAGFGLYVYGIQYATDVTLTARYGRADVPIIVRSGARDLSVRYFVRATETRGFYEMENIQGGVPFGADYDIWNKLDIYNLGNIV